MRRLISDGAPASAPASAPAPVPERKFEAVRIPHDPVNEQIVLLAARSDGAIREKLVSRLRADVFLVREHVEWWLVFTELVRRKLDYDPSTVRQIAGSKVDPGYLEDIAAAHGQRVPANVDHHVAMLEWDRTRVDATRGPIAQLLEQLRDPTSPPERIRSLSQQVSAAFERGTTSSLFRDPAALVASSMRDLRARRQRACYPYGIEGLDLQDDRQRWRMIPGAAPGKVTVITGVPGSGKSTVAARIALAQAAAGRRVLFGAWEPGDEDTLQLLAAMVLGMSRYTLSTTTGIDEAQEAALERTMDDLSKNIRFMAVPGRHLVSGDVKRDRVTNDRVLDQIHAAIVDIGADVAIFDLWKRCLRQTDPDEEEQALVRQQDIFARTKCHGILLQQQRLKDIEQRQDKRPTREGIKGSGAWVEIADTILGVHRPALWKPVDDVELEIDVLKQRWGPWPMAVAFGWDSDKGSITGGETRPYDQPSVVPEGAQVSFDDFAAQGGARKGSKRRRSGGQALCTDRRCVMRQSPR